MKKKFKSRKHIRFRFLFLFFVFLFLFLFSFFLRFFISFNLIKFDVISMISSSNNYSVRFNFFDVFFSLSHIDINNPNTILQSSMFYKNSNNYLYVANEKKVIQVDSSVPLVYIYNTHDTEEYSDNYGVYDASFYLKDKLSELGISSIVEENRTSSIRNSNGWNYNLSYKASRINLERVKSEYPSIKLFIDLHRDSVGHNLTFINIGGKGYAKVLFVIGREHANYLENLHYTQSIDYLIGLKYPSLSKGILEKEGPGVNGIYNQDIGYNVILLEVGGNENSSIEVKNTLDAISLIIKEKIYEEN